MNKRKASKLVSNGEYLLKRVVALKVKDKNGVLNENEFLVESFGAAKISYTHVQTPVWYEVWANLKNLSSGKFHKMSLERLMAIFPKNRR